MFMELLAGRRPLTWRIAWAIGMVAAIMPFCMPPGIDLPFRVGFAIAVAGVVIALASIAMSPGKAYVKLARTGATLGIMLVAFVLVMVAQLFLTGLRGTQ
jgi:hypothetical protein